MKKFTLLAASALWVLGTSAIASGKCGMGKCGGAMQAKPAKKCGDAKCGSPMKKAAKAKCGSEKAEKKHETTPKKMKCGAGKCGGN